VSGTLFLVIVANLVRICAVTTEKWPINWISKWRPPPYWILSKVKSGGKTFLDISFSLHVKLCANTCSKDRIIAIKWNLRWRPPPSWFYFRCQFWSYGHFPVVALDISTNFHKCTSTDCWVIAFCRKSTMAAVRHLELIFSDSGPPTKSSCRPKAAFQISYRSNM